MSFNLLCVFLILLQNRVTEQSTEGTTDLATDNTSNTETTLITEAITDSTKDESSSYSSYTETITSTESTTEGTTEDSNYNSTNSPPIELTSHQVIEDSITLTVSTESFPMIHSRAMPSDVTNEPENKQSNEEQYRSYEKNHSTVSVFGIVLASIVGTIAVFYITVLLIKQFRRKSYIVRTPSMELGHA